MDADSLWHRVERRAARLFHRNTLDLSARSSVVSFTFDDVPRSACQTGATLLEAASGKGTFYVCGRLALEGNDFFFSRDLLSLAERGHEIGSHGFSHIDYQKSSLDDVIKDIELNNSYFLSIGLPAARSFAYPYGSVKPHVKRLLMSRFSTLRGVENAPNIGKADCALLKSIHLYSSTLDIDRIEQLVKEAALSPTWLIFLIHGVTNSGGIYDIQPDILKKTIHIVVRHEIEIMTVDSALCHFSNSVDKSIR